MKNPEEYVDITKLSYNSKLLQFDIVSDWVKQAQIDAYNEALNDVVKSARTEAGDKYVDDESILKLKK